MLNAIFVTLVIAILILLFMAYRIMKDAPDRAELIRLQERNKELQEVQRRLQEKDKELDALQIEKAKLESDFENAKRNNEEKLKLIQDAETNLKKEFENLANKIFEDKGKVFTSQNSNQISSLLTPFKEQIELFRKRIDEVHESGTKQSAKLIEQVRQLQEFSNKVSEDANNLALAIKGDPKKQGNWGEIIVERIFEASGLVKGREYDAQKGLRTDEGTLLKPDFIVYLPENKAMIVDSKVSLTAYERYCSADKDEDKDIALKEHLKSVRNHLKELRDKDYSDLKGNNTLDFVLMCIPLEPAYQLAMQSDVDLIYDLAKTNVVITGPSTLMVTLKLIAQIWRREHESANAELIAFKAGDMYNQVRLVYESMADADKKLTGVSEAFTKAMKQLKDGSGNLVKRVEELRELGANVKRQLPEEVVEGALVGNRDD